MEHILQTSAETGENMLEANELPCPEAYVHPSHIRIWSKDERKVKSNIIELNKTIGNNAAWKCCTNPQVRILYLHNLCNHIDLSELMSNNQYSAIETEDSQQQQEKALQLGPPLSFFHYMQTNGT